jgi:hypothetical protein
VQFRLPIAIIVFLGSYLPLSMILLAQDYNYALMGHPLCLGIWAANSGCVLPFRNPAYSMGIFVVCLLCFGLTIIALAAVRAKRPIVIREAKYMPAELMNYTLPYVVSFMSIDYQDTGKFVGLTIFLAWMFWITYKSGQLILNPILIAFGWRLYEVSYLFPGDETERSGIALADRLIAPGERHPHSVIQDVLIIKTDPQ